MNNTDGVKYGHTSLKKLGLFWDFILTWSVLFYLMKSFDIKYLFSSARSDWILSDFVIFKNIYCYLNSRIVEI